MSPPAFSKYAYMLGKFTNGNGKSQKKSRFAGENVYIYRFVIAIRLSHVGIFTKTKKISRLIWRYDPKKGNSFKMRSSWFKKETHLVIL